MVVVALRALVVNSVSIAWMIDCTRFGGELPSEAFLSKCLSLLISISYSYFRNGYVQSLVVL